MMTLVTWALAIVVGYLCGSIPFAYLIGRRVLKIDIREHGSGNVGATNMWRIGGSKLGASCLVLDMLKGVVPTLLALEFLGETLAIVAGLTAVAGHMHPIWLKGSGGKGVATAAGIFLVLSPGPLGHAILAFLAVGPLATRTVSAGSIAASLVLPFMCFFSTSRAVFVLATVTGAFVIWRHRGNMKRLWSGTESRIWAGWKDTAATGTAAIDTAATGTAAIDTAATGTTAMDATTTDSTAVGKPS